MEKTPVYKHPHVVLFVRFLVVVLAVVAIAMAAKPKEPMRVLDEHKTGYTAEAAALDGCVVIDGNKITSGAEVWDSFVASAAKKQIRTVYIYQIPESGDGYLYKELAYDGSTFLLRFYDRTSDGKEFLFRKRYTYLVHSPYATDAGEMDCYLLADSAAVTGQGYVDTWSSSVGIPEKSIYQKCRPIVTVLNDNSQ